MPEIAEIEINPLLVFPQAADFPRRRCARASGRGNRKKGFEALSLPFGVRIASLPAFPLCGQAREAVRRVHPAIRAVEIE